MTARNALQKTSVRKLTKVADQLVYYFSLYAVPAAIIILSALALYGLNTRYPLTHGDRVSIRLLPELGSQYTASQALAALRTLPAQEAPSASPSSWFLVDLPASPGIDEATLHIPSGLTQALECWKADGSLLRTLGSASRDEMVGSVRNSKMGFAVTLGYVPIRTSLLCYARFADTGTLTAELWSEPDLRASTSRFDRGTGLLEGGLLTIALFVLVIAVTNREWIYLLLATWLVGNLRLGAFALGWDSLWLGHAIPLEWMPLIRKLTIAAYYLLTYSLLTQIFQKRLQPWFSGWWRAAKWAGLALLAGALFLPFASFTFLMWMTCGFGILVAAFLLFFRAYAGRARLLTRHLVILVAMLCVVMAGIVLGILGRNTFIDHFTNGLALLLANIMVALAVAERMREVRAESIRARTELVSNYTVTPIGMFTLSLDGLFVRANTVLEQMLGFSSDTHKARRWAHYFTPQDWPALAEKTKSGEEVEIELLPEARHPDLPCHFVLRIALGDHHIEGSLQDITSRSETIRQLRLLSDSDPLTNVLNRRGVEKALTASLDRLSAGEPCALAYINLDPYKRINTLFGHTSGDEVLQRVCERIKDALTTQQQVGRVGADEFVILFPDSTIEQARIAAVAVIAQLNSTALYVGGRAYQINSAMGIIEVTPNMDSKDMISAAGRACRDARKQHRDIVVYEHDSHELQEHTEELRLFDELEGSDSPRGLYLEMQPIMSMKNPLQMLNFEVLLRVRNSTGKVVPTGKIIAAAEENGTITIIDKWVFSATLEWLDKHKDRLTKTEMVNINLSGVSLNDDKFIDAFFAILARHDHLASQLCVEITEGVALQDLHRTGRFMKRLQNMGASVALDDFGAGYSSFSYLKELAADAIKIDGALIKDMMADQTNTAIVRTIIELARNLGMKSIAEWAEDCTTLRALQDMGVDYVQGFAVSKARPPADILGANSLADLIENQEVLAFIREIAAKNRDEDNQV